MIRSAYQSAAAERAREDPDCDVISPLPRVPSRALFGDHRELVILHQGQEYRLRITRAGKLILTK